MLNNNTVQGLSLDAAINMYQSVGNRNADFLFNWINDIYDFFYLPSIDYHYKDSLKLDKTKLTIFDVLVDDLADNCKIRNRELLEKAVNIPWNGVKPYKNQYLDVTRRIWRDCIASIQKYPRYKEFEELFFFDLNQTLSSMKYSYLANCTGFNNVLEDEMYIQHGVMVLLHADMDLMCSPTFDKEDLGKIRPILHHVQSIIHIGNLMNTYAREIEEADFSSPMISLALHEGLVDKQTIVKDPKIAVEKIGCLVPLFVDKVENKFQEIQTYMTSLESMDLDHYLEKLRRVWNEFLNREQYWKGGSYSNKDKKINVTHMNINQQMRWARI